MAEADELRTQLRLITESLQKLAECPVCLEPLKVPFKLCTRGHMMCCSCVKSLNQCPSCEAQFSIENPTGVRNLLEALPRFCRYSSDGCQDIVDNGSSHEMFCLYRPETCDICEVVVPLGKMLNHCESKHFKHFIVNTNTEISWNPIETPSLTLAASLFGHMFFIFAENNPTNCLLEISIQLLPLKKPLEDYYVRIKTGQKNFSYEYTVKTYINERFDQTLGNSKESNQNKSNTSSEETETNDEEEDTNDEQEYTYDEWGYYLKIPEIELRRIVDHTNSLKLTLLFFKEPKED